MSERIVESQPARNASDQLSETVENRLSPKSKDVVLFDGKNYIKKSGWKTPSRCDAYIVKTDEQGDVERVTGEWKTGKDEHDSLRL